jgi:hypothetical protein
MYTPEMSLNNSVLKKSQNLNLLTGYPNLNSFGKIKTLIWLLDKI